MFLADLPDAQRAAFPTLATAIIRADGRLATQENIFLERLRLETGAAPQPGWSFEQALDAFQDDTGRRAALVELIGLAWADDELADDEAVLLDQIADAWSIDPETRAAMFDWVERQTSLQRDAVALIQGEA